MTTEQSKFLNMIGEAAVKYYPEYKILPSLCLAQAILESNWGKSGLARDCFNYFGMKWKEGCGTDYKAYETKEQKANGQYVTIIAKFRKYPDVAAGIKGYYTFLSSYSRYKNLKGVTDSSRACDLIRQDGWATSLTYAQNLKKVIQMYNLEEWDHKAGVGYFLINNENFCTVRKGSKGDVVKRLQELLNEHRPANAQLKPDGDFQNLTLNALVEYQANHSYQGKQLVKDGIAGEKTFRSLLRA